MAIAAKPDEIKRDFGDSANYPAMTIADSKSVIHIQNVITSETLCGLKISNSKAEPRSLTKVGCTKCYIRAKLAVQNKLKGK